VKRAIVSDIHGNLEALQAVLQQIRSQDIDEIICLGDVVGYGPDPRACVDLATEFKVCLLGNHDQGALFDPEGFSSGAERAIFWTRQQLEGKNGEAGDANIRRWRFLCELPRTYREPNMVCVHGSVRNPLSEYVFPEDVYNARKMERIFGLIERNCFQGHTHVPGVFTDEGRFFSPSEIGHRYVLRDSKSMINVGSVGQPRDGDPRACFVVLDGDVVQFCRVPYDLEKTIAKIHAIGELDRFLGDRLREGR